MKDMAEKQQKLFYRLHEVIKEQWNKVKNNITSVEYNMNLVKREIVLVS